MNNTLATTQALPSAADITLARESGRALATVLRRRSAAQQIDFRDAKGGVHAVRVPTAALRLLQEVLAEIGQGNAVSITAIHAELTTQEAADFLNVSRPFLVQLLEQGAMPFHKTGTHRRVRYRDVIAYKKRIDAGRRMALDELAAEAQALGMGY